jgi:hypothetical protein
LPNDADDPKIAGEAMPDPRAANQRQAQPLPVRPKALIARHRFLVQPARPNP